jgi:hypothetical protein
MAEIKTKRMKTWKEERESDEIRDGTTVLMMD